MFTKPGVVASLRRPFAYLRPVNSLNGDVSPTRQLGRLRREPCCSCGGFQFAPARVDRGVEMLIDRVCPGGGWNAGNGIVYGAAVAPHPDDTAVALLALSDRPQEPVVETSVSYLERTASALTAPWSLAWSILALAAHHRPIALLRSALLALPDLSYIEDNSTLALVWLALNHEHALANFGVAI